MPQRWAQLPADQNKIPRITARALIQSTGSGRDGRQFQHRQPQPPSCPNYTDRPSSPGQRKPALLSNAATTAVGTPAGDDKSAGQRPGSPATTAKCLCRYPSPATTSSRLPRPSAYQDRRPASVARAARPVASAPGQIRDHARARRLGITWDEQYLVASVSRGPGAIAHAAQDLSSGRRNSSSIPHCSTRRRSG